MQWPLWTRQVIFVESILKEDNTYWFIGFSQNNDKYVRAYVNFSVY